MASIPVTEGIVKMDIYICETNKDANANLKNLCVRYFIQENIESDIWQIQGISQLREDLSDNILLNIFMLGIEQEVREFSDYIKACNEQNYIILLGSDPEKLLSLITPSIRLSGIIIRPAENVKLYQILDEIWYDYESIEENAEQFIFNIKAAKYVIPCNKILYFESSSKKIILRTISQEFEFYGSMQEITKELPSSFMRVHRSFIVNTEKIHEVDFGENTIYFEDDTFVYLSRSYKLELQKYLKR